MQSYISREISRPCKQWIHEVLCSRREADRVKLRTPSFVLLPDVNTIQRRPKSNSLLLWQEGECANHRWRIRRPHPAFHWLAVATDTKLRTLRDLRGEHIPMLTSLYTQSCLRIKQETGVDPDQIMVFIHYPPSVYQLHVHFKYPVSPGVSHDTFRVHPLATVINNLQIDGEYYSKSLLQLPVYTNTELFIALGREYIPDDSDACGPLKTPDDEMSIQTGSDPSQHACGATTTSPASRPSTPEPPIGTDSSSATPAMSP